MNFIPIVVEQTGRGERAYDIYSRLLKDRIVFLGYRCNRRSRQPNYRSITLSRIGRSRARYLFLHQQPRWRSHCGLSDLRYHAVYPAADLNRLRRAGGKHGRSIAGSWLKRQAIFAAPFSDHDSSAVRRIPGPSHGYRYPGREILRMREELNNILTRHTGQTLKKIEKDTDRDMFMTGKQAQEYGLVDDVIAARPEGSLKK